MSFLTCHGGSDMLDESFRRQFVFGDVEGGKDCKALGNDLFTNDFLDIF